jgi:ABC-type transport system involved in multi-copper enzyme maturation permease subunit
VRHLILLSWAAAVVAIAMLFMIGQLLVRDSIVVEWLGNLNPQLQAFAQALVTWLEQNPHISVRTTQNILFYLFSTQLVTLSFLAIPIAIPHLITRDLSSNAIVIYASKAVSRFDYLLGKFGTVMGLLVLTWLGPLVSVWLLGNLLAPNWNFFWHSRVAFGNMLLFVLIGMVFLSILALGVSAISSKEKAAVGMWVGLWIIGIALLGIARNTKPWLKYFSFSYNLDQISLGIFQLSADLERLEQNIPVFGPMLQGARRETRSGWENPEITGAIIGMSVMLIVAIAILWKRVKPE